MTVTCIVDFENNPAGVFWAGQVMSGVVTLEVDKPEGVKSVAINIAGEAEAKWKVDKEHVRGHEVYLQTKTFLLVPEPNKSNVELSPGIHKYTFTCHLPKECPSSFEGDIGFIRYFMYIELERPWKFDKKFLKVFTVVRLLDLNLSSPLLKMSNSCEGNKTFWCWPCTTDPLYMQMTLERSGFVPGQSIPINVLINNESSQTVEEVELVLVLQVRYNTTTAIPKSRTYRHLISKLKGEKVLRNMKKNFKYVLPVPATPPSCTNLSKVIQLGYQVEMEVKLKGWHSNPVLTVPVTIGSIPLIEDVILEQPTKSAIMSATENSKGPWDFNDKMSPQKFEETSYMPLAQLHVNNKQITGEENFAPKYPVFGASLSNEDATQKPAGTWL